MYVKINFFSFLCSLNMAQLYGHDMNILLFIISGSLM